MGMKLIESIAEVLEIEFGELFDTSNKQIFNFGGTHSNHQQTWNHNLSSEQLHLKYEFEKQ